MKRVYSLLLFLLILSMSACAVPFTGEGKEEPEPLDLLGEWAQENSHSSGNYQVIYISEDYIEIYWILGGSEGAALYWAGTCPEPTDLTIEDPYEWTSVADTSRTTLSILTDKGKSKKFKYENGKISYSVDQEIGTDKITMTVIAIRESWGVERLQYTGTIDLFDVVNELYQEFIGEVQEEEQPEE